MLATGLVDPYALDDSVTSLFVGQLAPNGPLLRVQKEDGSRKELLEDVSFVDFLLVRRGVVYFSDETTVSSVSIKGGSKLVQATASGPAGLDVTAGHIYFADRAADRLVQIDRITLETKELGYHPLPEVYRVAASEEVGIIYFSSSDYGIHAYDLETDFQINFDASLPPTRGVRIFGDYVYFTVPSTVQLFRRAVGGPATVELIADLSTLGVYPEGVDSDGQFVYVALQASGESGLIVRVPMEGGQAQVVAEAQGARPSGLVVDDACVYWTERETGSVFRAPKNPAQ